MNFSERDLTGTWHRHWSHGTVLEDTCLIQIIGFMKTGISHDHLPHFTRSFDLQGLNSIPQKQTICVNQCKMYPIYWASQFTEPKFFPPRGPLNQGLTVISFQIHWTIIDTPDSGLCAPVMPRRYELWLWIMIMNYPWSNKILDWQWPTLFDPLSIWFLKSQTMEIFCISEK